ncbi:MAG: class I SAM-dependent methyltransferase [Pyrinomonadaceae bacterium]
MSQQPATLTRADYGIDAPDVVRRMFTIGLLGVIFGTIFYLLRHTVPTSLAVSLANMGWWMGGTFLLVGCVMLWGSRFGKLRLRDRVLDSIEWRGDEKVLDVGCGHGLMLIGAAKRLKTGTATGVDIWQTEDQAGNSRDATMANVRAEGVADRIELRDADARSLPFADNTFDVILSSWALHNIYDKQERDTAIREIARVLKPGGRALVVDIRHVKEYAQVLRECGIDQLKINGPNFIFVIPTHWLIASKRS